MTFCFGFTIKDLKHENVKGKKKKNRFLISKFLNEGVNDYELFSINFLQLRKKNYLRYYSKIGRSLLNVGKS